MTKRFAVRQTTPTLITAVGALLFVVGALDARAATPNNETIELPQIPIGTDTIPVSISKIATRINSGQIVGNLKGGLLCIPRQSISYSAANYQNLKERLPRVFYSEAESMGLKTPADKDNLFDEGDKSSEYMIGVALESESLEFCLPYIGLGDGATAKGSVTYDFDWQIYSSVEKKIVSTFHSTGSFSTSSGSIQSISENALSINIRKFLASEEFRSVFIAKPRPPEQLLQPNGFAPISLSNSNDGPNSVPDDVGDVVAVVTGDGFGSGFLIDGQGLLLTNHHVVGESKYVKIRWPDGFETVGEVIRSDARRDVALLKTDPRGRKPLRVSIEAPSPGDDAYAIGTPLDQKFSSTVTKGIISANRIFEGLNFIQSDVPVNHGNSGGPLLDKTGRVIGITVSGYQVGGAPSGVNLFIPIRDAMEFLALSGKPPSPGLVVEASGHQ